MKIPEWLQEHIELMHSHPAPRFSKRQKQRLDEAGVADCALLHMVVANVIIDRK